MILDRFKLDGKVAIVTGAGRGIGEGIALGFAEAGADVVLAARTESQIEAVAEKIRSLGRKALVIPCDVMKTEQLENLVQKTLETFGRIDILVNNAGGAPYMPALQTSEKMLEQAFRFNVTSAFTLSKLVAPQMLQQGEGVILNISSMLSKMTDRGFVAYGTAKAALAHMSDLLANEFAPKIRVNALGVGAVLTSALGPFLEDEKLKNGMIAKTPLGRLGEPEDIASVALFLCSKAGSYVTGKFYEIDGGTEASNFPISLPNL